MGDYMNLDKIKEAVLSERVGIIGEDTEYRKYAVTIPIVEVDNKLCILFQVRAKHLRNQPGEISFPGGRIEKGETSYHAAIRETCEEIGLQMGDMESIGPTSILVTQHNRMIYPYVVFIKDYKKIKVSPEEVDHVFYVPLEFLLNAEPLEKSVKIISQPEEDFFPYNNKEKAKEYKWDVGKNKIYFYKYNEYIIWGITAKILHNFLDMLKREE
jgi:coenzyme A diphosphatase NUDT7